MRACDEMLSIWRNNANVREIFIAIHYDGRGGRGCDFFKC